MRKVTNHQALVHGVFAFNAHTRPTSLTAISGIYICGIYAELDGVGRSIDGNKACGGGGGIVLVSCGRSVNVEHDDVREKKKKKLQRKGGGKRQREYLRYEAECGIREADKVEAIDQALP